MKITLATLAQATDQEVFNQVAMHLLTQRVKSEVKIHTGAARCMYRAGQLSCAAGCLMSDAEYQVEMEANSWPMLIDKGSVPSAHSELIRELQRIHDDVHEQDWDMDLAKAAIEFGLQVPQFLKVLIK